MRLSQFIVVHLEEILLEWEAFAASLLSPGQKMTTLALRDHATQILLAVAQDIESNQSDLEQTYKSKGFAPIAESTRTAAMTHGALRYLAGFDLRQLAAEFRALRASVLRLWLRSGDRGTALYEMTRFNEAIDQALAESIANYSDEVARSRDTFLAILGHDLRSPLAAIITSSVYLASPGLLPAGAPLEAAKRIRRSGERMGAIIKDLLEYTRTRLGRAIPIALEAGSMEHICRLAFDEIRAAHPDRSFRLETSGELEGKFDGARLQRVLSNLLSNAVQHGSRTRPIVLSARGDADEVTVRVKNHGPSIPADRLEVIFNPLVQVQPPGGFAADGGSSNLGLGLYVAREIVRLHGGTIVARSSEDEGTVFSAHLPRTPPASQPAA